MILGALLGLAPALCAAQADSFRAIDRNGDGFISSDEWYGQKGVAPVPFTVVDLDGDGRISEKEFRDWSAARGGTKAVGMTPADRFRAMDKNRDGVISPAEWKDGSYSRTPFSAVDADKDGKISLQEFSAWDETRVEAPHAMPAQLPGTEAPAMSERLRNMEHATPAVRPAPRSASGPSQAPQFPSTLTNPSGGLPGSSPNMGTGSSLPTR